MTLIQATGIDEAGYGPLLGPLVIAAVSVRHPDGLLPADAFADAGCGVGDSKSIHTPGNPAAIEHVGLGALAWWTGTMPRTAADCFLALGESREHRSDLPWLAGAECLTVPVASASPAPWRIGVMEPAALSGAIIHSHALNQARRQGRNRHLVEVDQVADLIARIPSAPRRSTVVDRLGGRRSYGALVSRACPGLSIATIDEVARESSYTAVDPSQGTHHQLRFCVGGEAVCGLVAAASCIAKYIRELHMLLFNRYWCQRVPGLTGTAGYAADARRWIAQAGSALEGNHDLVVRIGDERAPGVNRSPQAGRAGGSRPSSSR